eukprot:TRINITY_DN14105_c1_g2_i1.p1 TRINITY_DN14105_c1_g2~~TRINITY_DN14105_c1_g2_i1.p1  ORF type:complete len:537 (+),score=70.27 TRINITY_DN14105_c1_g2_i1:37-1611(+)
MVFSDVGSKVNMDERYMKRCMREGVWISEEGLVTDKEIAVIREELSKGMERRGQRELKWFGANWKGHGSLEETDPMPSRSQEIVDKMCKKIGFPRITVSTLHRYDIQKSKSGSYNQIGKYQGRKIAIVPHTDDKLLFGNGGVVMLQLNGSADVLMSKYARESKRSDVVSKVHRPKGSLLVCEGDAFLAPWQHAVLWPEEGDERYMYTLTMRSLALPWASAPAKCPPKIFHKQERRSVDESTAAKITHSTCDFSDDFKQKRARSHSVSPDPHKKRHQRERSRERSRDRSRDRSPPNRRMVRGGRSRSPQKRRQPPVLFPSSHSRSNNLPPRIFRGREDRSDERFESPRKPKNSDTRPPEEDREGYWNLSTEQLKAKYSERKHQRSDIREDFYDAHDRYPEISDFGTSSPEYRVLREYEDLKALTRKDRKDRKSRKSKKSRRSYSLSSSCSRDHDRDRDRDRDRKHKRDKADKKSRKKEKKHKKEKRSKSHKRSRHSPSDYSRSPSRGRTRSYSSIDRNRDPRGRS